MANGAEFTRLVLGRLRRIGCRDLEREVVQGKKPVNTDVPSFIRLVEEAHRLAGTRKGGPVYNGYGFAY